MKKYFSKSNYGLFFYLYLLLGLFVRFYNFQNRLYFTWDSGRDAWELSKILHGDLTLIGPTSGIQGFFIGPAWFYLGSIGSFLTNGNPYGISLWYIAFASLSLIAFWQLAHYLFKDKTWAMIAAFVLAFIPGSIHGSTFVWNPLMSLVFIPWGMLFLFKSKDSLLYSFLSMMMWGLVLQSEFAYGVFFIIPVGLVVLFKNKSHLVKSFLSAFMGLGITLVPQILFELRHGFIMTKSIMASLSNATDAIGWLELFDKRPRELFWVTKELLFRGSQSGWFFTIVFIGLILFALYKILKLEKPDKKNNWLIISLFTFIPYFFFLLWRGNHGNFFDYYLTPHFIFLVLMMMFGLQQIMKSSFIDKEKRLLFVGSVLGLIFFASINYVYPYLVAKSNPAGLKTMMGIIDQVYGESGFDKEAISDQISFLIFTPNAKTDHYDYLISWKAGQHDWKVLPSAKKDDTLVWYVLIEPDQHSEERLKPRYIEMAKNGTRVRSMQIGSLVLEKWVQRDKAAELGLKYVEPRIDLVPSTLEIEFTKQWFKDYEQTQK